MARRRNPEFFASGKGRTDARVRFLADFLESHYRWAIEKSSFDDSAEMDTFEQWLNNFAYLGRRDGTTDDILTHVDADEVQNQIEIYTTAPAGHPVGEVRDAIRNALLEQGNWYTETMPSSRSDLDYSHELFGSIYIEPDYLEAALQEDFRDNRANWKGHGTVIWVESDVKAAPKLMSDSDSYTTREAADVFDYSTDEIWAVLQSTNPYEGTQRYAGRRLHPTVDISQIDTELVFGAYVNWLEIDRDLGDDLADDEEEVEDTPDIEETIFMRLDDGFYVADLTPGELPRETREMAICIGDRDYGPEYARKIRDGEGQMLSLRNKDGESLLTIEVELAQRPETEAPHVLQVKGDHNRFPGWGRGDPMTGKVKAKRKKEVLMAVEIMEHLGVTPETVRDLQPALRAMGTNIDGRWVANPRRKLTPYKTFNDPPGRIRRRR